MYELAEVNYVCYGGLRLPMCLFSTIVYPYLNGLFDTTSHQTIQCLMNSPPLAMNADIICLVIIYIHTHLVFLYLLFH